MLELVKLIRKYTTSDHVCYQPDNSEIFYISTRWEYEIQHLLKPTDTEIIIKLFRYYELASLTYSLSDLVTHLREVLKKIYT